MALVSEKHNFIFIHIFRAGGNSTRKALGAPAVGHFTDILGGKEVLGVHVDAVDLKQHYHDIGRSTFFESAYKFTIVRNPFSWLVSTYKYIKYSPGHNFNFLIRDRSFFEFLNWYKDQAMTMDRPFGSNKYLNMKDFIVDENGNRLVNYVGKLEQLPSALARISKETGVKLNGNIPKINKTTGGHKAWRKYYQDQRCIKFVQKHFGCDLKMFNYSWR